MAWFIIIIINDHEQHIHNTEPCKEGGRRSRMTKKAIFTTFTVDNNNDYDELPSSSSSNSQSNSSRWWQNSFHVQRTVSIFTSQSHGVLWFTFDISHNLGYQWRDLPTWLFEEILIVWKASAIWVVCSTHAKNGWWSRGKRRKVKRRIPLLLHGAHVIRLIAICGTKGRQRS